MSRIHKVEAFDSFAEDLRKREPEHLSIAVNRHLPGGATIAMGGYGDFIHGLFYVAKSAQKERYYREDLFQLRRQGAQGWNREDVASIATSTGLLVIAAEIRLERLQEALPDTNVYIHDPATGEPVEANTLSCWHDEAIQAGATVPVSELFLS